MIKVQIIADSVNVRRDRIISWILTYPRFIHAEFMTHRTFSRNAASSRAIPIEKMLSAIRDNPAMPEYWGANQRGMQASTQLEGAAYNSAVEQWLQARDEAVARVEALSGLGVHKQIANRVTEPWSHITVMATATEHRNFFNLRAHKDAQPEFQVLAYMMLREYLRSVPQKLQDGDWHIPFGDRMPEGISISNKLKIATARAARVSYITFDGAIDPQKDYDLHDRLAESGHWSPFEHCAKADASIVTDVTGGSGNFKGWVPYRKQFSNEQGYMTDDDLLRRWNEIPSWVQDAINRNDINNKHN